MDGPWNRLVWQQFGAALDMLDDALQACPDALWCAQVWEDPDDQPGYSQVWFVIYHTLRWVDLYLDGTAEGWAPAERFNRYEKGPDGVLPITPYSKADLQAYLQQCRDKCRTILEGLTEEEALALCRFDWFHNEMPFLELQLYSMRHVQEHAAQLSLLLGHQAGYVPDWVEQARSDENRTLGA